MIPRELLKRVRRIELATRRRVTSRFSGGYLSIFRGQGMEFEDVRAYQPGDDVRTIDWNVTARTGHPHVKRFVVEREMTVLPVVDVSASLGFGTQNSSKLAVATELSALLAFLAVGNHDRVGLVLAADKVAGFVPPGKGRRHLYRVIRELLQATAPEGAGTDLAGALDFARRVVPRHSTLFVVSDFLLPPGGETAFAQALGRAARHHDTIAVSVEDPVEAALPDVGLIDVVDPETGMRTVIDAGDPAVRAAYSAEREERLKTVRRAFTRFGVDYVPLSTATSYMEEVLRFFHTRTRRLR
ncbi:MAG: DUF58 domain-containing protein [Nitrospirota bacterium]|nr:DUF58 domain-containing protein [Nitrospirota bacterium]